MKYAFIQAHSNEFKVSRLIEVLDVSSGYYDWVDRPDSSREKLNRQVKAKIKLYHKASNHIYGSPRIHMDLLESGEFIGVISCSKVDETGRYSIKDG